MKEEQDYIRDLAEIRSMMERSSKFLSLSGLAGVLAGIYALTGVYIAYSVFNFNPNQVINGSSDSSSLSVVLFIAMAVLLLAIGTAIFLSRKKAQKRNKKVWNAPSKRMIATMAVPLSAGGIFILLLLSKGLIGLIAPSTLLFYGLALYSASQFTFGDLKFLGVIQMGLGLMGTWFVEYGLLLWALGFGVIHIIYGIYMHLKYER
jgi:uncharacterized membrane protein YidH (DUF202 family)